MSVLTNLTNLILNFITQLAVTPVFLLFLAALFLAVMTWNYRRFRRQGFEPDYLEQERPVDRFDEELAFRTTRTVLTNRRVLQLRLSWFLSRRRQVALGLKDVTFLEMRRGTSKLLLVLALLLVGRLNPAALIVALMALESKVYSAVFDTRFTLSPRTRLTVSSFHRRRLRDFVRFYRTAHLTWAKIRTEEPVAAPISAIPSVDQETDLTWGRPLWVYVTCFVVLGILQRVLLGHVTLDDAFFGPVYLALPVAVASRSRRDGLLSALFGFVGLLTVKFPSSGFGSVSLSGMSMSDSGSPDFRQYGLMLAALLAAAWGSYAVARAVGSRWSSLSVLVVLPFVAVASPSAMRDLLFYAGVATAVVVGVVLRNAEGRFGARYGAGASEPGGDVVVSLPRAEGA
jgi:hypothetical protein